MPSPSASFTPSYSASLTPKMRTDYADLTEFILSGALFKSARPDLTVTDLPDNLIFNALVTD